MGYHVSQPCEKCLGARNNGHFWMFYSEFVRSFEVIDAKNPERKPLLWVNILESDVEHQKNQIITNDFFHLR